VERDGRVSRRLDAVVGGAETGDHHDRDEPWAPDRDESPHGTRSSFGRGARAATGAITSLPSAFDPGRRGLRALAVVAAVVTIGAGAFVWWTRPQSEPVSPAPLASVPAPVEVPGAAVIVVAVTGKVKQPGLVRLPVGSRIADAIAAAGGIVPGADLTGLNLARKVVDGELVTVGVPTAAGPATGGKVNLNTATVAQLDALPGVGPVLAQRILDWRDRRGGFRSVTDLRQVEGIGDAKFDQLKDLVTV
jgi:competence protein ComEA